MKKKAKTLITIPVYNGEKFIAKTLETCIAQTRPTEIWVVDNCSTDNTRKIVKDYQKKYPNIKLFRNKQNLGRIGNWNRCLDLFTKSKYLYIKYVFAGDEIFPNCIEEVEKTFLIDKQIGAIAFLYEFVDLNNKVSISEKEYDHDKLFNIKEINYLNFFRGGLLGAIICNAYSKKAIGKHRFNELFIGKSDFDFEVLSKSKAYFLNKVLARFNLDAHRTFFKSQDYISEAEFVFIRAYHLEKNKGLFTNKEYKKIREKIFIEFVTKNMNYYPIMGLFRLWLAILLKLPNSLMVKGSRLKKIVNNYLFQNE